MNQAPPLHHVPDDPQPGIAFFFASVRLAFPLSFPCVSFLLVPATSSSSCQRTSPISTSPEPFFSFGATRNDTRERKRKYTLLTCVATVHRPPPARTIATRRTVPRPPARARRRLRKCRRRSPGERGIPIARSPACPPVSRIDAADGDVDGTRFVHLPCPLPAD